MDPDFLRYYEQELQFIREMGAEFAKAYPKIASRLGLEGFECADPYVERLLEGFAFLTARVQLKLDSEFPTFTQHLLEMVYPHYLTPVPSMVIARFQPDTSASELASGFVIPGGTSLRSILGKGERTACEYRTASDVALWPIELAEVKYLPNTAAFSAPASAFDKIKGVKAGIRFRLRSLGGVNFDQLPLSRLRLFVRGAGRLRSRIYGQLAGHALGVLIEPAAQTPSWRIVLGKDSIEPAGFADEDALLPYGPRSFQGYRLLQEYFAFPDRFHFVDFSNLDEAIHRCDHSEIDLVVLLGDEAFTEESFDSSYFSLYCTPAINLFPKRADRIHLKDRTDRHHIVPDRSRPLDFEVYAVKEVAGIGSHAEPDQEFLPFYASHDLVGGTESRAYFVTHREPRVISASQRLRGSRSSYIGSEVFVSLVDAEEAPYRHNLRQLAIGTICTNRDLPLLMPVGKGNTDFTLEISAPVQSVRCVAGPTKPRPTFPKGDYAWRLISHLSLNYLSISNTNPERGAAALRELLDLYSDLGDAATRKQIAGVGSIATKPITRRLPGPGRVTFARGVEVTLSLDPTAFEGTGTFLLGAVLEKFFSKYVSINSFTETIVHTEDDGEIMRWPARLGRRQAI
jgi:type VI secretion system protein ImpG